MNWGLTAGDRVRCLQTQLFPVCATLAAKAGYLGSFLSNSLKTNQLEVNTDSKTLRPIARLKEPRELFALPKERDYDCPQQAPRWPIECQVQEERIYHINYAPDTPEPYYQPTGKELQPRPVGEENGVILFNYNPTSAVHYFSRSTVGGSKAQPTAHPNAFEPDDLIFESRFESGNLGRAIKITPTYYELYLRPDMYTNRHTQWFYFRVKNTKAKTVYRFSIINLTKPDSLYKEGMRPLMYSTLDAEYNHLGWQRCGENIAYFRNDTDNGYNHSNYHHRPLDDDDDEFVGNASFTLSFNIEFRYDDDTVFFAHSYPYTYSDLQDYLMGIQRNPVKSKFCKLRLLCRSLAGNNVYYLTVTAPSTHDDDNQKKKKAVIISARVHPGESPSSWMMKGLMDFITGDSYVAKKLRHKFIFKLVPMLNPDGVIVGNTRSSLTGRDLNRQYRTVIRETYPSIWNTKAMIRRLMEDCGVAMYCDMHAHSRKHNVFIYGCENLKRHPDRRLLEQVFPLMLHKNVADKFSFENCKFKVQKNKEGTGRIVVWVLGVTNSYTLEASFGGSTMGGRAGTHFSTADYEHIGRAYCETLMDYYDDNPIKEKLRMKILTRLSKEGSSAEEPLNIPLSDYSSDEGDTSTSSSEDEAGKDSMAELEGPCCSSLKVPPSSPVLPQKFKGNKKGKKQSRTPTRPYRRRSRSAHRIVLDIPTAEPASDFFDFTSDDEESPSAPWGGHPMAVSDTENTVKRNFRRWHKCRASDRIRKLTALGCETQYLMPPELIVRSAASRYLSEEDEDDKNKMVMSIIKEFPPIINKERSWQGFNRADRHRDLMKAISPDHFQGHSHSALSLKRSIWTGTQSDGYVNEAIFNNSRPLSWGVPPVLVKSTYFDNEALLTACSQKLAAWKDEKRSMKEKHHKSMSRLQAAAAAAAAAAGSSSSNKENRSSTAGSGTKLKLSLAEQYSAAGKSSRQSDKKQQNDGETATTTSGIAKVRRKTRSTLNKIVEKAELITHLSRSARSSGTHSRRISAAGFLSTTTNNNGSPRKATSTSNLLAAAAGSPSTPLLVSSQSLRTPNHDPSTTSTARSGHRFRTGGIVVTAAQPLPKQRRAHLRSGLTGARTSNNSPTKLPTPTTTTIDIQLTTLCSETESEKNLKIISSKKHKKKRTAGGTGTGGTGSRDKSTIKILT
ncbi:cytosolic carboxypeptidase 2 isoform X4 [Culex pipiens pallens]|uniref:cytosolic carboxypeptidase 2 isoform X4 n=1 Tax=Culex pipiens pallens TaxID=42434 RepID=UPI001952A7CC|nr:cytosolic carboxypeptidase 2 isoform X4 [Culex pipiens pallens]